MPYHRFLGGRIFSSFLEASVTPESNTKNDADSARRVEAEHNVDDNLLPASSVLSTIETHFTNNWIDNLKTLYGLIHCTESLHQDLTSICSFDRSLVTVPLGTTLLSDSIANLCPGYLNTENLVEGVTELYQRFAASSILPTRCFRFGSKIVYTIFPECERHTHPASGILDLLKFLEEDSLVTKSCVEEVIVLCQSPKDFAIEQIRVTGNKEKLPANPLPPEAVREKTDETPVRRGKHELIHGAQFSAATEIIDSRSIVFENIQTNEGDTETWFSYLLECIKRWKERACAESTGTEASVDTNNGVPENSFNNCPSRAVTIVSAGWANGCNFEIVGRNGIVVASHHSLMETKYESSSSTTEQRRTGDDVESIVSSMMSMLPQGMTFSIHKEKTSNRFVSFTRSGINFTSCITDNYSQIQCHGIERRVAPANPMLKFTNFSARTPIIVKRGPQIVSLGSDFVELSVSAVGFGELCCKIYSIPMQVSYEDIKCMSPEELKYLTLLGECRKHCRRETEALFRFSNLKEYSAYCAFVETSSDDDIFRVACFKTHGGCRDSVHSIVLTTTHPGTLAHDGSAELTKLVNFLDRPERAAVSVNVVELEYRDDNYTSHGQNASRVVTERPSSFIRTLEQRARVTVTKFTGIRHCGPGTSIGELREAKWNKLVDISIVDQFCKLTPRDSSVECCVYAMIDALDCVRHNRFVTTLAIISPVPYVPYLYRNNTNCIWSTDGSYASLHQIAVERLFRKLFAWKQESSDGVSRDCIIFSVVDIKDVGVAHIWLREVERSGEHNPPKLVRGGTKLTLKKSKTKKKLVLKPATKFETVREDYGNSPTIRNILLPARIMSENDPICHKFANETSSMSDSVMYHVYSTKNIGSSVQIMHPRADIYGDSLLTPGEPIVYTLELTSHCCGGGTAHGVVVRMTVHEIDNFRITLGPIVGEVSETTAAILIEINSDIPSLRCQLLASTSAPLTTGDRVPSYELAIDAKTGKLLRFDFSGLLPGMRYHVCFPDIVPNHIIGSFQTLHKFSQYAQLAFIGKNVVPVDLPVIRNLFEAATNYQLPNSRHSEILNILSRASTSTVTGGASIWKYLKYHLIQLQTQTSSVIHIGSHALLAQAFNKAIKPLLSRIFNLQKVALSNRYGEVQEGSQGSVIEQNKVALNEVTQSSLVVSYFADEIKLLIREIFRVLWNVPELQEVLANGFQIPLFHNDYYTPFSLESLESLPSDVDTNMLLQAADMIQDYVRTYSQSYVLSIRESTIDKNKAFGDFETHFYSWRKGSMAVLGLDLAENRVSDNTLVRLICLIVFHFNDYLL